MERLTTRREDGRIETRGISYSELHMDYVPSARINDYYDMRLAAYEDTGLTPEEVADLQSQLQAANERAERVEERVKVLERALVLACAEVVDVDEGNCPGCVKSNKLMHPEGCSVPKERYKDCWRDYFLALPKEAAHERT